MGSVVLTVPTIYDNGSYFATTSWYSGSDETTELWTSAVNNAGTQTYGQFTGSCEFFFNTRDGSPPATPPDGVFQILRTDMAFDLRKYAMLPPFTSASLSFWTNGHQNTDGNLWATEAQGGIGLVGQRQTARGIAPAAANHYEIYLGSVSDPGVEMAQRINYSDMLYTGSNFQKTFTLNANGLSYLNDVKSKANNPGWLFMGIVFGGEIDVVAPTIPNNEWGWQGNGSNSTPTLTLGWSDSDASRINIGDSWRSIAGIEINAAGTAWKDASALNINIGDVWKDKK